MTSPQVVGKVVVERLVNGDGLAQGKKIWCPIKGVGWKHLKENYFLFTFHQHLGKCLRVLEDGPWMFGKDMVVHNWSVRPPKFTSP